MLPLFLTGFATFWLALALNLAGLAGASTSALVAGWADQLAIQIALDAFLIPISVAMSTRTFALCFRTPLPRLGALQVGLALLLAGLALRLWGGLGAVGLAAGLGRLVQAAAFVTFILMAVAVLAVNLLGRPAPLMSASPR